MKKIQAAFYTFEEMEQLLEDAALQMEKILISKSLTTITGGSTTTRTMGQMISVLHYLTLTHCRCFPK